ncbi:AAA family ATPase [Amycolatopsis nalaikhensis]|uniref:Helix-turn-helix domain-containing protein n=1 Tax=Amycolatopsis nalaikhensis TaxID=715472 RepID=A0ABY8XJ61_9PSEU|nr:helix-turn-helix domain-containing protein [Amycolatopsis sp. 2-2]WIV55659.1 helix-turn-helix domain-containing protein [Amycolatopsis sp. 2-2]
MPDPEFDPSLINDRVEFGHTLEALCQRARLSGREAARRAGIPVTTLNGYLRGRNLPQRSGSEGFIGLLEVLGIHDEKAHDEWLDTIERIRRRPGPEPADGPVPYRGLEAFDERDTDWFFGRTRVTNQILNRIHNRPSRGRPLFVVGSSGVGKSSVLKAGVMPALAGPREGNRLALFMTPGHSPCLRLADLLGVDGEDVSRQLAADPAELSRHLLHPALRERLDDEGHEGAVLIIDQFEELFSAETAESERQAFLLAIGYLANPVASGAATTVVVLGMRVDFLPQATDDLMLAAALNDDQVVIGPMSREELTEVIKGPAAKARLSLEPGLVDLILSDLAPAGSAAACDSGALPLLAHALRMTWERREHGSLTVAGYRDCGGIRQAVAQTADAIHMRLEPAGQDRARSIFLRLVHTGDALPDTRRRVPTAEIEDGSADDLSADVLDRFVNGRLLTVAEDGVEIAHEALILAWPRLRTWLDDDRAGHALHRRLGLAARTWQESGEDGDLLYRGGLLTSANEWVGQPGRDAQLNATERDFLAASNERHLAEQRDLRARRRIRHVLISIVAVCVLLASAMVSYAVTQSAASARQRDLSQSRELATQADRFRSSDVSLAAQLSLEAYRISPTPQARASVLDASASPLAMRLLGPLQVLQAVSASSDGTLLATAGTGRQVQLWTRRPGELPVRAGPPFAAADETIFTVAFTRHGSILATGGGDRRVRLWDVTTPAAPVPLGGPLTGFGNTVYSAAFSPDGTLLAVGSADETIRLFSMTDPAHPVLQATMTGFTGFVQAVAFAPDGRTLAAGGADRTVRLWDVGTASRPAPLGSALGGPVGKVLTVAFAPDGRTLAAGSADKNVYAWDTADVRHPVAATALTGATGRINALAFTPDGTTLAAGSSDSSVRVWDRTTGRVVVSLPHPGPVTGVEFLDGGSALASVAADGVTRLWPVPGQRIGNRANSALSLEYAGNHNTLITSAGLLPNTTELWETTDPARPARRGRPLVNPHADDNFSGSVSLSPDGRTAATGLDDGFVVLFDVTIPDAPRAVGPALHASDSLVETVEFSRNGRLLAVGTDDRPVTLWDVSDPQSTKLVATLQGAGNSVYSLSFSADDSLLAAGSLDGKIWLWDVSRPGSARPLPALSGFDSYVHSVVFSPKGPIIAAGGADKTVRLWDLADPAAPRALGNPLVGATNYVYSVAFSPDGGTLAAGGYDHTVWTWDMTDPSAPRWLATLTAAQDSVFVVEFAPDGHALTAGTAEKAIRLWETDPDRAAERICAAVGQRITEEEWARYVPGRPYDPRC